MLPFLFHGASAVRSSAISSIRSLLLRGEEGQEETGRADGLWTAEGIGRALQALVQAGVTERSARNTEAMAAIASEVAGSIPSDVPGVSAEICGRVRRWMDIGTLVAGERMERGSADVLVEGAGALGDAGVGAVVGGEEWQSTHGSAGVVARVVGALGGSALDGVVREVLSVVEDFAVRSKCSCVVLAGMTMVSRAWGEGGRTGAAYDRVGRRGQQEGLAAW